MPIVRLREEVYQKLKELKASLGHASFNETVSYLIEKATDPKTFLESLTFWLQDLMHDVKRIALQLENLNCFLKKLSD